MPSLSKLQAKLGKQVAKEKKHTRKWKHYRSNGKKLRAKYHRRRQQAARRAIRKIKKLIKEARAEQKKRQINWSGKAPLTHKPLLRAVRVALEVEGLYITSTTGGTHSATSWHYKARAFDGGSNGPGEIPEIRAQNRLLKEFGAGYFAELFGPDNWYVKNGVKCPGTFPGHADHLHVAVA
jgi:hypothetical protein